MNKFKRNSEMEVSRGNKKAKIWIFKVIWICQKKMFYILRILVTFYDNIPSFQKKNVFKDDPYFVHPKLILHNRSHATIYSDPRIYLHIIIMQKDMNRAMNFPFSWFSNKELVRSCNHDATVSFKKFWTPDLFENTL